MKVTGASLENGLLAVDLKRDVPEALKPRRIAIGGTASAIGQDKRAGSGRGPREGRLIEGRRPIAYREPGGHASGGSPFSCSHSHHQGG